MSPAHEQLQTPPSTHQYNKGTKTNTKDCCLRRECRLMLVQAAPTAACAHQHPTTTPFPQHALSQQSSLLLLLFVLPDRFLFLILLLHTAPRPCLPPSPYTHSNTHTHTHTDNYLPQASPALCRSAMSGVWLQRWVGRVPAAALSPPHAPSSSAPHDAPWR